MLNELNFHRITNIEVQVHDHSKWIDIQLQNSINERFEITLYCPDYKTALTVLRKLRDSTIHAIDKHKDVDTTIEEEIYED
jgi:translation initiation factor 2 alpha subunit (eIF-2alpha)|tara:strand:- start:598 stop:840 length:243 start_codon:yes stop_codon:yes gene_type:complete